MVTPLGGKDRSPCFNEKSRPDDVTVMSSPSRVECAVCEEEFFKCMLGNVGSRNFCLCNNFSKPACASCFLFFFYSICHPRMAYRVNIYIYIYGN